VQKCLPYTIVRTQAMAPACLFPGSSKGAVTRDGDNELAIHFIAITNFSECPQMLQITLQFFELKEPLGGNKSE